ncbi:MAG: ribonuclease P protein component [Rickettsiales bacterium]|jgi:ribonuclease P protein component|nr:ribonuclease P protein component [Rickettsiales bacterium]
MRNTIKKHSDFIMAEDDPVFRCPWFIARARKTKFSGDARFGLTATKRTFKHAVDRNRAKRLLRAWLRANEARLNPELDYVFIARAPILETDLKTGKNVMKTALKKLAMSN